MNDFCQWFQRKRSKNLKKLHKNTKKFIRNRDSNLISNKSGRGPRKKHPNQICNKSVHRFKRWSKMGLTKIVY